MPRLSGVEKAAFVNDSTQTVVRFDRAHEDTTVDVRQMLDSQAADTRQDDWFVGYNSSVEWMQPDLSSVSQMETWMADETPVQFVAIGPETIIQWYEPQAPETFQSTTASVGDVDPLHGRMRYGGGDGTDSSGNIVGYPNGSHRIYASKNALHPLAYDREYSIIDVDGNNIPDGYTYTTGNLENESVDNTGSYSANGPTNGNLAERGVDLLLPFENVTWTLSVEVQQVHADGDTAIYLSALDSGGSTLASQENVVGSAGRYEVQVTAPTNTYQMRAVILRINNVSSQLQPAAVTKPALRVEGGTTYVTR